MKFENSNWILLVTNVANVSMSQNKLFMQVKKGLDLWNAVFWFVGLNFLVLLILHPTQATKMSSTIWSSVCFQHCNPTKWEVKPRPTRGQTTLSKSIRFHMYNFRKEVVVLGKEQISFSYNCVTTKKFLITKFDCTH